MGSDSEYSKGPSSGCLPYVGQKLSPGLDRLDHVSPNLILAKIFEPYRWVTVVFGQRPFQIDDEGRVHFKLFSVTTLWTLTAYLAFISDSFLLVPMYVFLVTSENSKELLVVQVAQIMFLSCQYLGALFSYIISIFGARYLMRHWNRVQKVVGKIASLSSPREFLKVYLCSKWNIKIWVGCGASFCVFCVFCYSRGFEFYMGPDPDPVYYWLMYAGLVAFPYYLAFHILHSVLFVTFCGVLTACFRGLRGYADSLSSDKFGDPRRLYEELNELVQDLGKVGGPFIVLEVLVLTVCVTMNAFFIVAKGLEGDGILVNVAMILPYICWFHWLCGNGEELLKEAQLCYRSVKALGCRDGTNLDWTLIEPPVEVTACGYFAVRMKLFTTVMGTIATYLVVLLQFKFSSTVAHGNGRENCSESE